jgi:hypothetical protein
MAELSVDANIVEIDGGPYYPVRLAGIPRVGELVDLYSFREAPSEARRLYEVVQVLHKVYDVTEKEPGGHHHVTVFVRPSQSAFFGTQ